MPTDALDADLVRPTWRGRLHFAAALVAVPAGAMVLASASRSGARIWAGVFVASVIIAFGVSATYHFRRPGRARAVWQRLDHSMIYVLIAGTYTPVCLLGVPARWGVPVLAVVWLGAIAGIVLKVFAFNNRAGTIVAYALYPVLGWAALAASPVIVRYLTPTQWLLVLAGGVLYTVGFPVLLLRRPNPWPRSFGYHEIWHAFTVAACACHFLVVASLVR